MPIPSLPPGQEDNHIPKTVFEIAYAIGAGVIAETILDAMNILLLPGLRGQRARGRRAERAAPVVLP
jgi:hypothetical protein